MPWLTAFSTSGCSSSGGTRQRRGAGVGLAGDAQPLAEPHLLDGEEPVGERELLGQRNLVVAAESQRFAKEVGQQQTHAARGRRVGRGQGAD